MLSGTDKWEKVVTLDPSVTVHCIQNLKERSEFFFRVLTENPMGLSAPAETGKVALKTHATVPSPPTSPLEVRPVGPNSIIVEWGIPESDGGAAIDGYIVAVRDSRKTMWMEVGQVGADTTRLIVKDMQVRSIPIIYLNRSKNMSVESKCWRLITGGSQVLRPSFRPKRSGSQRTTRNRRTGESHSTTR